mmetsp:Transcript_27490/g.41604  ORF Transcript_27490/g.41604 Transcript_27490/m.41604 type:complete len:292 (+) Transcript_27490:51-926(+)
MVVVYISLHQATNMIRLMQSSAFTFLLVLSQTNAFAPLLTRQQNALHYRQLAHKNDSFFHLCMNFFDDLGDMMTGGKLTPQTSLPYEDPFSSTISLAGEPQTFAVAERLFSFTGEDFDVKHAADGSNFVKVRGAMMHLPGKDKMRMYASKDGEEILVLDRVLIAATPSYDIYRGGMGAEKIGWMEKKLVSMTDTFDVYMEGKGGFGVTGLFKPPPAYQITGDFIDRNFVMKNDKNEVVAKISEVDLIQFDGMNHYQVQVAPGMDSVLVLACACAIDEEFDEEHKAKRERQQ